MRQGFFIKSPQKKQKNLVMRYISLNYRISLKDTSLIIEKLSLITVFIRLGIYFRTRSLHSV